MRGFPITLKMQNEPKRGRQFPLSWGRGAGVRASVPLTSLFACQQENVQPDVLALATGMTGGYLPMAATLTTQPVFDTFLGDYSEFKSFFHGHSFTGNQLGGRLAALASLDVLQSPLNPFARERIFKKRFRPSLPNSGLCPMSATSGKSALWPESNLSKTGEPANRFLCAIASASASVKPWPVAAC